MAPALVAVAGGGGRGDYPGKLTGVVTLICIVAAMGGLSFGYDIGISGGVTSMPPFLKKFFPAVYRREQSATNTNQYCTFNDEALTLFTSSLYLAALVASFVASYVTRKLGRRLSMFLGGLIFFIGAVLNAGATGIWMLILGRILLGIGVGFSVQSVPVYVSEMAPYKHRGKLNVVFQLSITIGILVANVVNYGTSKIGNNGWRVSLGGACVPAAFIFVSAFFLPNSPNSMLEKGEFEKARAMLQKIRGVSEKEVEAEFQNLVAASEASKKVQHPWRNLIQRQCRPQLTMSILIPFFQQLTGINVVMFYAPVLFRSIGFKNDASLMSAAITGGVNVAATFLSIATVDKLGRRFWFLQGGGQMIIFQSLIAGLIGWKFGVSGQVGNLPSWYAVLVVTFICIYVAAFAWSWGPLGWLVPSEIFPLEIRSAAQSINASVNMLFTFVIAELFLKMLCSMKFGLFIFFAVLVVFMTVFVYYFLPETKGIPIEEMSKVWRDHWFWRRFVPQEDDPKAPRLEMV